MSEQELTKWKNKYRLWKILHGGGGLSGCSRCKLQDIDCNEVTTLIYDVDTKEVFESKHGHSNYDICIEWIKDV